VLSLAKELKAKKCEAWQKKLKQDVCSAAKETENKTCAV
jgi:hypothetical protein